jgi:N-acetylmuramoyl-L-alanine amidase CwlA
MPQTRRAKKAGNSALDRLQTSIDAAETALKDLRREVGRESQERLKDVGTTLTATRKNLTRSRNRIMKDLEQIEHRLMKGKAKGKAKAKAGVRSAPKKRARKTSRTSTTRSTRTTARKSPAKAGSRTAAKARSKRPAKPAAKKPAAR